jgi:hypothetical protein
MMMKTLTTALLFSVAAIGTACSAETQDHTEAEPPPAETASTEPEVTGTLNLNIGQPRERGQERLLGSGALGSATFGDAPDLGIGIETDIDTATLIELSTDPSPQVDEDDGLIRIP